MKKYSLKQSYVRKLFITTFLLVFLIPVFTVYADTEYDLTGANGSVKATLSGNVLTISGSGDMDSGKWNAMKIKSDVKSFWSKTVSEIVFTSTSSTEKIYLPLNCEKLFRNFKGQIHFNHNVDTSKVTSMNYMFDACTKFNDDISDWDVQNVTGMVAMLRNAKKFNANISNWNMSSCRSVSAMLLNCAEFNQSLANWNTTNIISFSNAFSGCTSLSTLDPSSWNTSKVIKTEGMFLNCSSLQSIDLSKWDTSKVKTMASMFKGCSKLNNIDISKWNTSNVTTMAGMFDGCSTLRELDLSKWDTSKLTTMSSMFVNCSNLESVNIENFDTSNVTVMNNTFYNCSKLDLSLSKWDTSSLTSCYRMFRNCSGLTNLDLSSWDTSNVTDMHGMFRNCGNFNSDLSNWDTSSLTTAEDMFNGAGSFNSNISGWDTSNVTNMRAMFYGASSFDQTLADWDTSNVTCLWWMFANNRGISKLDTSKWDISNVSDIHDMLNGAKKVKKIILLNAKNADSELFLNNNQQLEFLKFSGLKAFSWTSSQKYKVYEDGRLFTSNGTVSDGIYNAGHTFSFADNKEYRLFNPDITKTVTFDIPNGCTVIVKKKGSALAETQTSSNTYSLGFGDYTYQITGAFTKPATAFEVTDDETIVEKFTADNIIPANGGANTKPDGYITVRFTAQREDGVACAMTGETVYYVNPYTNKRLSDLSLPTVADVTGFETVKWSRVPSTLLNLANATAGEIIINGLQKHKRLGSGVYYKYDDPANPTKLTVFGKGSINKLKWDNLKNELNSFTANFWSNTSATIEFDNANGEKSIFLPSDSTELFRNFKGNIIINNVLNTSKVQIMNGLFWGASKFNDPSVSSWDVSKVTNMRTLFMSTNFNQTLHNWDTSNVEIMRFMFCYNNSFNQDISAWDVSNVSDMQSMFDGASKFNQSIKDWDTSKCNRFGWMLRDCSSMKNIILLNRTATDSIAEDIIKNVDNADVIKFKGLASFAWTPKKTYKMKNITNPSTPEWTELPANLPVTFNANDEYHIYATDYLVNAKTKATFDIKDSVDNSAIIGANIVVKAKDTTAVLPALTGKPYQYELATFKTYAYTITKAGYQVKTGEFELDDEDKTVEIHLEKNKELTVDVADLSHEYDGMPLQNSAITGTANDSVTNAVVTGTWSFVNDISSFTTVGTRTEQVQFIPNNPVYGVVTANISLDITPKALDITGLSAVDKKYDGNTNISLNGGALSGVIAGDVLSFDKTQASVADENVGDNKVVDANITLTGNVDVTKNYTVNQPSLTVNITPADFKWTVPTLTATYDESLGDVSSPDPSNYTIEWLAGDATKVGNVGTRTHQANLISKHGNYGSKLNQSLTIEVSKKDPADITDSIDAKYNQTLNELLGSAVLNTSDGIWEFDDALDTKVGNIGTHSFAVTFKPNTANYTATTSSVDVVVAKADAPILAEIDQKEKVGVNIDRTIDLSTVINLTNAQNVSYATDAVPSAFLTNISVNGNDLNYQGLSNQVGETLTIPITVSSDNFADSTANVIITIEEKDKSNPKIITVPNVIYGNTLNADDIVKSDEAGGGTWDFNPALDSLTTVGSHSVHATFTPDDNNYASESVDFTFTIDKANLSISGITASDRDYDGSVLVDVDYSNPSYTGLEYADNPTIESVNAVLRNGADAGSNKAVKLSVLLDADTISKYNITCDDISCDIYKVDLDVANENITINTTYVNGQTLADLSLPTSSMYTITWQDNTTEVGDVGDHTITAILVPKGAFATNHRDTAKDIKVVVEKADMTEPALTLSGKYHQKLADVDINTSSTADYTLTWQNDQLVLGEAGTQEEYFAILTPTDTINYNGSTFKVKVDVTKADAKTDIADYTEKVRLGSTGELTFNLAKLVDVNFAFEGASLGTIPSNTVLDGTELIDTDKKTLKYQLNALASDGDSVTIPLTLQSKNYQDSSANLIIEVSAKDTPVLTINDITKTFDGVVLTDSAIQGTANYNSNVVAGTFSFVTDVNTLINAGDYTPQVKFTPNDTVNYEEVIEDINVKIAKANCTGTPSYTSITEDNKTLADVNLQKGSILQEGTISFDMPLTTVVEANKAYSYTFTPNSTYSINYEELKGSLTPYVKNINTSTNTHKKKKKKKHYYDYDNDDVDSSEEAAVETPAEEQIDENVNGIVKSEKIDNQENSEVDQNLPINVIIVKEHKIVDTSRIEWYAPAVKYVLEQEIMDIEDNNKFYPNMNVTRNGTVNILYRISNAKLNNETFNKEQLFSDVNSEHENYQAIEWAKANNVAYGYSDGRFNGSYNVTREQFIAFLYRTELNKGNANVNVLASFSDANKVSEYAEQAMAWGVEQGLIVGTPDNELAPQGFINRAEIASIMQRYLQK